MLAMHADHLSNDTATRSLSELEHFLTDLSTMNTEELQNAITPEPLRVRLTHVYWISIFFLFLIVNDYSSI